MSIFSAIGVGLGLIGLGQSSKAGKEARAAARARAAIAKMENFRTTVNVVREARIKRGQVVAAGEASGVEAGSSGLGGALSSLEAQLFSNLDYLKEASKLNSIASSAEVRSAGASGNAFAFQSASNLVGKIPDIFGDVPLTSPNGVDPNSLFESTPDFSTDNSLNG